MANILEILPFTLKWEGGLSRATTDKASLHPSPYTFKGVKGWHTNKGVTYPVFKDGAKLLNYQDTAENWFNMPMNIWVKIAKFKFWDKLFLDNVKSQAIANAMFSWQWGAGYGWRPRMQRYFLSKGIKWNINDFKSLPGHLNTLSDRMGEKNLFDELIEQQIEFYKSLNEPVYIKGWLNRVESMRKFGNSFIQAVKSEGPNIAIGLLFAAFIFYMVNRSK
jgi:hypothetical protein